MNEIITKFNLYEYFRILLPGFYCSYIGYEFLLASDSSLVKTDNGFIVALLVIVFSLIIGSLIYALDLCRLFKGNIHNLPTNLMEKNYPAIYPSKDHRKNEHIYYSWYNKADSSIRNKTELQSGLYHLTMNFALTAVLGLLSCFFREDFCTSENTSFLQLNITLFFLSILASFIIVNRRLKYLWQSNFWTFEKEVISQELEKSNG